MVDRCTFLDIVFFFGFLSTLPNLKLFLIFEIIIFSVVLLFALMFKMWYYRRIKTEQEITGLLWRIDMSCIKGYGGQCGGGMHSYPSKQSLVRYDF